MFKDSDKVRTRVKVELNRIMFPKFPKEQTNGDFTIGKFGVLEVIEGNLYEDKREISIKGNMFKLDYDEEYIMDIEEEDECHPIFGMSYNLVYARSNYSFETDEDARIFLSKILTENQIENLYEALDCPIQTIAENDIESLMSVKGIGEVTAERIMEKYLSSIDNASAYIELEEYGLTKGMIDNLIIKYKSPDVLIQKIKDNPYVLVEVGGIGWKKCDEWALNGGLHPNDIKRVIAFIDYILFTLGQQGYSWIDSNELIRQIEENLGESIDMKVILDAVKILKDGGVVWNEEKGKIGSMRLYNLELNITKELIRLLGGQVEEVDDEWKDRVKQAEILQGWEFTDEQKDAIKELIKNPVSVLLGKAGCVDADTEYFNGAQWVRIADYKEGDKVLQFNEDRTANLVYPQRYIKEKEDVLYKIQNYSGTVDQIISDDHDIGYITSKGNVGKIRAIDFFKNHNESETGAGYRFLNAFDYVGGKGINITNEWLRIMIALVS